MRLLKTADVIGAAVAAVASDEWSAAGMLAQRLHSAGPASQTLDQHCVDAGRISRAGWSTPRPIGYPRRPSNSHRGVVDQ